MVGVSTGGGAVGCVTIGVGLGSYNILHIPNKTITTIKVKKIYTVLAKSLERK